MSSMDMAKSVHFLLENAGPVIQYRLRKEILNDITPEEEECWLRKIYETEHFMLLLQYVKSNGIVGGLSILDKNKHTRLQDCEAAARLLSNYAVPKHHLIAANFVAALRNDDILREEMEPPNHDGGFEGRFDCLHNGNAAMSSIYNMQAMLGYGDDYDDLKEYQKLCLQGFRHILSISDLNEIIRHNPRLKNNAPHIEAHEFFPNIYTLSMLAYTKHWRSDENVQMLANYFNHLDKIGGNGSIVGGLSRLVNGKLKCTSANFTAPIRAFEPERIDSIVYRRILTEIAMTGVGQKADVIAKSIISIKTAMDDDGILRLRFDLPHNKHYSPRNLVFPTKYADTRLEPTYKAGRGQPVGLLCDLTFWAVQFLYLASKQFGVK